MTMTRDDFFLDVTKALHLLVQLGVPADLAAEMDGKIASMRAGGPGVTPDDLRRYSDSIDWARQDDPRVLSDLSQVLLRLLAGLGSELESFRRARQ
jgi:hypothetical protein